MTNFALGQLVTLPHHPYFKDRTEIFILADATMVPPIMVVTELLYSKNVEDITATDVVPDQIKCEFYSHKSHKFESNWFLSSQLKKIETNSEENYTKELPEIIKEEILNSNVILKTWKVELVKKKISLQETTSTSKSENRTITAHLNFLPPVMILIKVEKNNKVQVSKKPVKRNRIVAPYLYKCKWFNPKTDSISEGLFTPESLELIINDEEVINLIQSYILSQKFFKFTNSNILYNQGKTIGKAVRISYNHCYYELEYFDYLTNKTEKINLSDYNKTSFSLIKQPILKFAPAFSEIKIGLTPQEFIEKVIIAAGQSSKNKIFKIYYTDRNEFKTIRTITNCIFFYNGDVRDIGTSKEKKTERYLKATCFLRNGEDRYFKFENIQGIELLNL